MARETLLQAHERLIQPLAESLYGISTPLHIDGIRKDNTGSLTIHQKYDADQGRVKVNVQLTQSLSNEGWRVAYVTISGNRFPNLYSNTSYGYSNLVATDNPEHFDSIKATIYKDDAISLVQGVFAGQGLYFIENSKGMSIQKSELPLSEMLGSPSFADSTQVKGYAYGFNPEGWIGHRILNVKGGSNDVHVIGVDSTGFTGNTHGTRITDTFYENIDAHNFDSNFTFRSISSYSIFKGTQVVVPNRIIGSYSADGIQFASELPSDQIKVVYSATDNIIDNQIVQTALSSFAADNSTFYVSALENSVISDIPLEYPNGIIDHMILDGGTAAGLDRALFIGSYQLNSGNSIPSGNASHLELESFIPHSVFVISKDGSTSHATPRVAAWASNLASKGMTPAQIKQHILGMSTPTNVRVTVGYDPETRIFTHREYVVNLIPEESFGI